MRVPSGEVTYRQGQQLLQRHRAVVGIRGRPRCLVGIAPRRVGVDAAELATVAHERAEVVYGAGGLRCDCTDSGSALYRRRDTSNFSATDAAFRQVWYEGPSHSRRSTRALREP